MAERRQKIGRVAAEDWHSCVAAEDWQNGGRRMTEWRQKISKRLTESGRRSAECGRRLAECGRRLAECRRRLAEWRYIDRQKIARVAEDSQNVACQKLLNFRKFTKRYVICSGC